MVYTKGNEFSRIFTGRLSAQKMSKISH